MHDEKLQTVSLSPGELEALWSDLYSQDGARAYRAVWTLTAGAKQSVPFLQNKLKPVPPVDPAEQKRIARLIVDLNSDDFDTREKASHELVKAVDMVESVLRKALDEQPAPEFASAWNASWRSCRTRPRSVSGCAWCAPTKSSRRSAPKRLARF